jgi:fibronectin-binding autotransporter adhesin
MKPKFNLRSFFALVGSSLLAVTSASAQSTLYWDGGTVNIAGNGNGASTGGNGTWNTTLLNWDAGVSPRVAWDNTAPFDTAVLGGTAGTVTLGTSISVDTININTSGYNINPSATNQLTVSTINAAGGATSSFGSAGTVNIEGSLLTVTTATASDRFSFAQEGATNSTRITLNESVSAATSISGPGFVNFRLIANNTTGGISITGGATVLINNTIANSLGTNNLTLNGGVVQVYTSSGFSRALGTGSSQVQLTGGTSGFSGVGNLTLGSGTITWGSGGFAPDTFVLEGSTLAQGIALAGTTRTISSRTGTGTISGAITTTGTAGLIKEGAGLLSLTNTGNTYNGGTTVNGGTLAFGAIASMPSTGVVALANNTAIGINLGGAGNWSAGTSGVGTLGGLIGGLGGAGSSTLTYTGSVGLRLNVLGDSTYSDVIPNLDTGATTLTKLGANLLTLTNANTFSGAVNLEAGTLRLENVNAIGSATALNALTGTTLQLRSDTAATFAIPPTTLNTTGGSSLTINADRISSGSGNQLTLSSGLTSNQLHGNETTFNFTGGNGYTLSVPTLAISRSGAGGAGGGTILNATTEVAIGATTLNSTQSLFLRLAGTSTGNTIGAMSQVTGTFSLQKQGAGTWRLTGSNSFTGTSNISGGVLEVAVMANGGTNSGLGRSANTAANVLLGNGTTLRYVGSTDAVTNRAFTINGTAAGHGTTIESSGDGTLTFDTPATALAYGTAGQTRALTLGGTNTGANTFGKILADNGAGATSLTKAGLGTWVLTQANTYTGATTVNGGGTLLVNNTTDSGTGTGAVTVNAGTLGGTGSISGAVTIGDGTGSADAILAPGTSIESLATGNLAFDIDGSYAVEVDGTLATSDQTLVTGTVSVNAAATLAVNVTGTLVDGQKYFIVVNDDVDVVTGTFDTLPQGALVGTYGGFDLRISYVGDSVGGTTTGGNDIVLYVEGGAGTPEIAIEQPAATDIPNGGSQGFGTVTLGSNTSLTFTIRNTGSAGLNLTGTPPDYVAVSGTNAADFVVTAQPSTPVTSGGGTTTFTVRFAPLGATAGARNAVLTVANNDSDEGTFTINVSGTAQTPYDAWSGGAGFDVDTNGDGVDNGLAFLLGAANPNADALGLLPEVTEDNGNLVLNFSMLNAAARGTASLSIEHSSDLGIGDAWEAALVPDVDNTVNDVVFDITGSGPLGVEATIPSSKAVAGKLFGRLKATE